MIENINQPPEAIADPSGPTGFVVYPAIDLRHGQVVRLMQGDPARQTTYGSDPARAARRWLSKGARWLHVINLDGAFGEGGAENLAALSTILDIASRMAPARQVQFGGGIRTMEDIERALSMGVSRVMLGSIAVESPEFITEALSRFGSEPIGLAMDVRDGFVRIHGWTQRTNADPIKIGQSLYAQGLRICAYTDIDRDGGGGGLNLHATHRFAQSTRLDVIASGGANDLEDVRKARELGLKGVIIGRALYEGIFGLEEALSC